MTVVADLDDDAIVVAARAERDEAALRFSGGGAIGRELDAVIDRVANRVDHRGPERGPTGGFDADAAVDDRDVDELAGSLRDALRFGGEALNADYFKRIDALNYSMMHDDGQHVEGLEEADVVLVGVSRTSKTPTSIYLANRGVRTANVPLVPGIPIPHQLETLKKPLVVSLHATPERLIQVRQNRLLGIGRTGDDSYIDRQAVAEEVAFARRLSAKYDWALLDVTRRSIEETAAAIMKLYADRQRARDLDR